MRTSFFLYMLTPNRAERNWFRVVARTSGVEVRGSEGRHPDKTRGPQNRGSALLLSTSRKEISLRQEVSTFECEQGAPLLGGGGRRGWWTQIERIAPLE